MNKQPGYPKMPGSECVGEALSHLCRNKRLDGGVKKEYSLSPLQWKGKLPLLRLVVIL